MSESAKKVLFLLRVALGCVMLYAGLSKLTPPGWSAAGYLQSAQTLSGWYQWLASPANISWVNFLNEWGLTLLGISLILGIGVRLSSALGSLVMALYYIPILHFPYVGKTALLVDEHIIYILILWFFATVRAGRVYGLETWCANLAVCKKYPRLHAWFG